MPHHPLQLRNRPYVKEENIGFLNGIQVYDPRDSHTLRMMSVLRSDTAFCLYVANDPKPYIHYRLCDWATILHCSITSTFWSIRSLLKRRLIIECPEDRAQFHMHHSYGYTIRASDADDEVLSHG